MHILYAILVGISLAVISFIVLNRIFKPFTSKNKKFVEDSKKAGRSLNQFTWKETRDELAKKIKYANMSVEFKEEMDKDLNRLAWNYKAEDIRKLQIFYTAIYLVLSVLMLFVSTLIGIIMLAFTYVVWNIPVNEIRKEIKMRNEEFIFNLYNLYLVIYNQYKRKNDEHLGNIIYSYLPNASELLKKELMIILRDTDSGEEYALKQLKKRIPNPVVLRFCDIISTNLEGVDNREVMENFYLELKNVRDRARRKRNEQRAARIDKIVKSLWIPLGFLIIVYLTMFTLSSFN